MKLRYQETGGFAGLTRSAEASFEELDPREAEAVHAAAAANPSAVPDRHRSPPSPDLEVEQLYLVHDDGRSQPLLCETDEATAPVLRKLVDRLRLRACYTRN